MGPLESVFAIDDRNTRLVFGKENGAEPLPGPAAGDTLVATTRARCNDVQLARDAFGLHRFARLMTGMATVMMRSRGRFGALRRSHDYAHGMMNVLGCVIRFALVRG
ncbi:MAG: hypothetical protein JRG80_18225 [Deltaproteobacteria bacterium]|nr:hypothetical protein [Deltaproteobacteria bacterium]